MDQMDIRARLGVRPIINVSGTMTALGASIVVPEAVAATAAVLNQFVEVDDLQRKASRVIARLCDTEAGFVTASCAAAMSICVAAAMTGSDLYAIERLPDAAGLKDEVIIQSGHMVAYGAPVEQSIRLAGARVVPVGQALEGAKRWAAQILECSPLAVRASKQAAMRGLGEASVAAALGNVYPAQVANNTSMDYVEGPKAFAEKRKPNWQNK